MAKKPRARKTQVKPRKKSGKRIVRLEPPRALAASAPSTVPSTTSGAVIPLSSGVVVGLGASAGGLTALEQFFSVVPPNSGAGYVIVVHLDPTHVSSVAAILGRHAAIPVKEAQDDDLVLPDHAYVIPPNRNITIERRRLRLQEPSQPRGFRMPIDRFFASLGDAQQQRAVGIILSGTGSDGTNGLKAIKSAGGLTIAQDPQTAEHSDMIRSAIDMGVVDTVLSIRDMPERIATYAQHAYTTVDPEIADGTAAAPDDSELNGILAILRTRGRLDFTSYRKGTIRRRIQRRMGIRQIEGYQEYLHLLREDPVEVQQLASDMLIGVTGFFRERQAWDALEESVIRPLVAAKSNDEPIRVWVPACASGEEAYSIAMVLFRALEQARKICPVQIFATDIDHLALEHARMGVYPESAVGDIRPDDLQHYFMKEGDRYRVGKGLRDGIVFAAQNLITDPPYSKLDLITCRNLLIYFEPDRQRRLLSLFHFALREGGYLFLGSAETIGAQTDQFMPISRKWRIFRRTGPVQVNQLDLFLRDTTPGVKVPHVERVEPQHEKLVRSAQHAVLRRFAPACTLVDRQNEIRFLYGPTDRFLRQPEGQLTSSIFDWCRGALRTKLRGALHRVWERDAPTESFIVRAHGSEELPVRVIVEALKEPRDLQGMALIAFHDSAPISEPASSTIVDDDSHSVIQKLQDELKETRDDLQTTIEELQTSNEEFKAVNEEALSINEELQSTNEELETSKEELQSLNEELLAVNFQLQSKLGELEQRNDDLDNLLRSTDLAAIFLDRKSRIKWFSPAMTMLLSLIPTDVGRPLRDFAARFTDPDLLSEAETVLRDLAPIQREIQTHEGRWYLRRLLPYRTRTDRIDGIVITFMDITALRLAEQTLQERAEVLEKRIGERTSVLKLLQDVAEIANQAPSVDEALRGVLRLVCTQGRWDFGHVWQVDDSSGVVIPTDAWHLAAGGDFQRLVDVTMKTTLGPGEGLIRRTLASGQPQWVEDTSTEIFVRGAVIDAAISSMATVPVFVQGRPVMVLEFGAVEPKPAPTASEYVPTLTNIGIQLGHVVGRQVLEKHVADQSDRERRSVGQELHDTVGQSLAALAMTTGELLARLGTDSSPHVAFVAKIRDGLESAKTELRNVIRGMLPVEFDGFGLMNALLDLSERTEAQFGIKCRFVCDDPSEVGVEDGFAGAQLYRIAQEAVRNAATHSDAHEIVVELRGEDRLELVIRDNGSGDWSSKDGRGSGIRIMRYRADLIGGRIDLKIERGVGTTVRVVVPKRFQLPPAPTS